MPEGKGEGPTVVDGGGATALGHERDRELGFGPIFFLTPSRSLALSKHRNGKKIVGLKIE
jgi:hypothetical protein